MKSYRTNYAGLKFKSLPHDYIHPATGERLVRMKTVKKHLGISHHTFQLWRARGDFVKAAVCFKSGATWYAYRDRLYEWLVYIGAIKLRGTTVSKGLKVAQNPPLNANKHRKQRQKAARKALGL